MASRLHQVATVGLLLGIPDVSSDGLHFRECPKVPQVDISCTRNDVTITAGYEDWLLGSAAPGIAATAIAYSEAERLYGCSIPSDIGTAGSNVQLPAADAQVFFHELQDRNATLTANIFLWQVREDLDMIEPYMWLCNYWPTFQPDDGWTCSCSAAAVFS